MNAIKERRAGVAVNAGDRSEGAFYCPVQGGGGGAEFSGPASQIAEIVNAFPWLEMKQRVARAVCGVVETRPATAYDNFARDFGERFMPGYKRRGPRITANLVLHCFQEKTRKTSQQDLDLAAKRFKSIRVKS